MKGKFYMVKGVYFMENLLIENRNMLIQLMTDFNNFLENEANKLSYDKDELQSLIKDLLK